MTKASIRLIIMLMSIALLGLVGFQIYWISNALKVNEERFKKDVQEALNAVSQKLEKQETLSLVQDNIIGKFTWANPTDPKSDTVEYYESSFQKKTLTKDPSEKNDDYLQGLSLGYQIKSNNGQNRILKFDKGRRLNIISDSGVVVINKEFKSGSKVSESFMRDFEKVTQKTEDYNRALMQILIGEKKLEKRIDEIQLDSLLKYAFKNKNITLDYDYGVLEKGNEEFVYSKIADNHLALRKTDLKASLFPNDLLGVPSNILVRFPKQDSFLMGKMWFTLLSSIVLIAIILFSFGYAILTIIKQKKISEVKNDFINNMTHEFKTPISTVSLACEALKDKEMSAVETTRARYIDIIQEENKRLGIQVEKVLQMAMLDKGEFNLKITNFDLHQVIEKAAENFDLQVRKKGGKIQKQLTATESNINADQFHVTNIIRNLLDNANKYSPDIPEILIQTENINTGIIVKIIDKGIGISKETLSKIFDKFYRVHTGDVHDVKGFGLGLAYVKTMIEAHDGSVTAKSELLKGAEFELFFPQENTTI